MFKRKYLLSMIAKDYDLTFDEVIDNLHRVKQTVDSIQDLTLMELDTWVRKIKYLIEHPKASYKG
jgi:hypothetical protein